MYLTRFPINVSRRSALRMTGSPYAMHAAIEACFPSAERSDRAEPDPDDGRLLWRLDRGKDGACLYIVSPTRPSLIGLDEQLGFPDIDPQYQTCEYDSFLESLSNGQVVSFRLVANPVIQRNHGDKHKAFPHVTARHQLSWLIGEQAVTGAADGTSRIATSGLTLCSDGMEPQIMLTESATLPLHKSGHRNVNIAMARYDGIATISDADALRKVLTHGLGRSKSFGCGLMTVSSVTHMG